MKPPNSPPLRVVLGVLVVDACVSVALFAWESARWARDRAGFGQSSDKAAP